MNELDHIALECSRVRLTHMLGVEVLGEWRLIAKNAIWMLRIRLALQGAKPTAFIMQYTEWELVVDFSTDPWGKVQLHPTLDEQGISATFAHQQFNGNPHPQWPCRNGHICTVTWLQGLIESRNAQTVEPNSTIDRLCWHVIRAQEWLALAATDALTELGDPFELPDFAVGGSVPSIALAYCEDNFTFQRWQQQGERSGLVELVHLGGTLLPRRFYDARGRTLLTEPPWGEHISQLPVVRKAIWVRLNHVPVINKWQVPTTWAELIGLMEQQGIDLADCISRSLAHLQEVNEWLLLLGMPIPRRIGEESYRYHWQALQIIPSSGKLTPKSRVDLAKNRMRSGSNLHWVSVSTNWHPEDLQNRGRLAKSLCNARVIILGAGALGSTLAELLVRMGIQQVTIIDGDHLEPGNLVRHTLSISDLYQPKAKALANRLNQINPSARVTGLSLTLPTADSMFETILSDATLIIDATASDIVLKEMPFKGVNHRIPFVSCSLGLNAERMFFYAAPSGLIDWQAFDEWFRPYRAEENQLARQIELPRGIGCWHTLVPARLNRLAGLAGMAVELIEQVYTETISSPLVGCYSWTKPALPKPVVL